MALGKSLNFFTAHFLICKLGSRINLFIYLNNKGGGKIDKYTNTQITQP